MNEPEQDLLLHLALALRIATHQNVAQHLLAGFLWACYPEWFDQFLAERTKD